jgi:TonB family protein
MRSVYWGWGALLLVAGCTLQPQPRPDPNNKVPMEISPTAFSIRGPHFTPGEAAIVKVCVRADGAIASTAIVQSSGERRFDESAVQWALHAGYRPMRVGGAPIYSCDEVRVEMRQITSPGAGMVSDSSLG